MGDALPQTPPTRRKSRDLFVQGALPRYVWRVMRTSARSVTSIRAVGIAAQFALALGVACAEAHAQCTADIDQNAQVGGSDLTILLSAWGTSGQGTFNSDLNNDGIVGGSDLTILLSAWGPCAPTVPDWATLIEALPDPAVVPDAALRSQIIATGLAWRVRDAQTLIEMLLIPPGSYQRGCSASLASACNSDENPRHTVTLTNAFYLGRYEVTQAQWVSVIGSNPSAFQGDVYPDAADRPVEQIGWDASMPFFKITGMRMPTEAEWEYAFRAGTGSAFHGTANFPAGTDDDARLPEIAWFAGNNGASGSSSYGTKRVGLKAGNGFGLHDMAGNVFEWVNDWWGTYEPNAQVDPTGPLTGSFRVLRGGNWLMGAANCRASARYLTLFPSSIVGIRAARNP